MEGAYSPGNGWPSCSVRLLSGLTMLRVLFVLSLRWPSLPFLSSALFPCYSPLAMLRTLLSPLFLLPLLFLLYTYLLYPLAIRLLARLFPRPPAPLPDALPLRATAILSALPNAPRLRDKLRELLALPPSDAIDSILLGLDGAPQSAAADLRADFPDTRLHIHAFAVPRGKAAVLADLIPLANTPALLLLDVRQTVPPGAPAALLRALASPDVAVASGELVYTAPFSADAASADTYWSFEKKLRAAESAIASVPGATGALYAIRRSAAVLPPPGTLNDDVLIPMRAILAGGRCLFVAGAICHDVPETDLAAELRRKRRTAAGNWQLLRLEPRLLSPFHNPIFIQFMSHKIFRVATPFACLLAYLALIPALPLFLAATALLLLSMLAALLRRRFPHPLINLLAAPFLLNITLLQAAFLPTSWR